MGTKEQMEVIEPLSNMEQAVEELVGKWAGNPSKAIMALLAVSEKYNWLPQEALNYISKRLDVPKGEVYQIATFYRVFSLVPRGKHILSLCMGTACHVGGAILIADALKREHGIPLNGTSDDGLFTLERVHCIGACAIGPVLVSEGKYHGNITQNRASAVVKRLKRLTEKELVNAQD